MAEELELNSTQVEHEYGGSEIQVLEGPVSYTHLTLPTN